MVHASQIVHEEEYFVLPYRASEARADIVIGQMADRGIEKSPGVHIAVLQELVSRPVVVVSAGLEHYVSYRSAAEPEFRIVVSSGDIDRLDGFGRWDQDLHISTAVIVVDAIDL